MASVSPRTPEPQVRERLVEAAATLLADEGPAALSTRRLANEVGTSTMAVYTHFGGLPQLVRAVVNEGFARLAEHMDAVPQTDDPLTDVYELGVAYRANAHDNPHLYVVMFGSASLGGYRLAKEELAEGRYTFDLLVAATQRVMDAGIWKRDDPEAVAGQLWCSLHGFVMLEFAGFFAGKSEVADQPMLPSAADRVLLPMMTNLAVALSA
jgi:AcrR family transcriptional regulator